VNIKLTQNQALGIKSELAKPSGFSILELHSFKGDVMRPASRPSGYSETNNSKLQHKYFFHFIFRTNSIYITDSIIAMDITDMIADGQQHLEKKYNVGFDEIDSWDSDEAFDFVHDLSEKNPEDEKLQDLSNNLYSISTYDFVLSVEMYAQM